MGLDITAISKIAKTRAGLENTIHLCVNKDFPEQADGLEDGYYKYAERLSFRAGTYSGYNQWRDKLAQLAPVCFSPNRAFLELINFSDCEGTIGPKTSTKLLKDFQNHEQKAKMVGSEAPWDEIEGYGDIQRWFLDRYGSWLKAFKLASDNGAVIFH